jgi:hypothetical protein
MKRMTQLYISFALLLVAAAPSHAGIIVVSNRSEPLDVEFNVVQFAFAESFTTASGAYTLNSVIVSAFSNTSGRSELRLRTDVLGMPGLLVENLGLQTIGPGQSSPTYISTGSILQANTTYWLTLGETGPSSGDFQWDGTLSTAETSPVSWTIADQALFSTNGGATWKQVKFGPPNVSTQFAIEATPAATVPEPGTCALGLIGLGALLRYRFGTRIRERIPAFACGR